MSSFAGTTIHLFIYIIIGVLGDITCMVLLLYHIYQFYKHEVSKNGNSKSHPKSTAYKLMSVLTMSTVTFFTLTLIIGTSSHFICILSLDKVTPIIYNIAKCSMYLVFIMRLHYVYNKSKYAYNRRLLEIWSIILIVAEVSFGIYGYLEVFHYNHQFTIFGYDVIVCQKSHGPILLFFTLSFEIINTITTLFAFIRPLIKIMKSLQVNYENHTNKELKYPVIKTSILTLVASITTLFAIFVSIITDTDTAFIIDIPFNCLCIMLMTNYYSKWYEKLCCVLIKCISAFYGEQNIEENMTQHHVHNREHQIDENKCVEFDTCFQTATIGISPDAIKYENESEFTQTVKI
eukprot:126039_1